MEDEALTIVDRFRAIVTTSPNRTAIVCGTESIDYRRLDAASSALAMRLIRRGVRLESLVGVVIDDRAKAVVAILGAMKSGAAYVPLDLTYPPERLSHLVREAGLAAIVAPRMASERLRQLKLDPSIGIVYIDDALQAPEGDDVVQLPAINPDNLAYVIYTSGSTGGPKGVMVSHRSVMRLFHETADSFEFSPDDTWPLLHSIAFDFSVWEIGGALLYGGCLAIPDGRDVRDPAVLCEFIARAGVTVLNQTPSFFYRLCTYLEQHPDDLRKLSTVKLIIFGGERLDYAKLARWYALAGQAGPVVVNMYGITETTVHVTLHPVDWATEPAASESVIGDPIADLRLFILDEHLEPVPQGVVGEIFVSGPGLARGYQGRPDLTADAFMPCPYAERAGERMYRTGDLAKWMPDGTIGYVSRKSGYLKVRGFRVSLGEIEAALRTCDGVQDAYVSMRSTDGVDILDAYLKPEAGAHLSSGELREQFGRKLPSFCAPQNFYSIETIPLTRNGKIDLATMKAHAVELSAHSAAMPSEAESALLSIWRSVLGSDAVSVDTDFFEAGGDSIRAVDLALAMTRAGWRVGVQDIFMRGSVRNIAAACNRSTERHVVPARCGSTLASDMQTIMLNAYEANLAQRNGVYHVVQSFDLCDLHADVDLDELTRSFIETFSAHPVFSTVFVRLHGDIVRRRADKLRLAVSVTPNGQSAPPRMPATAGRASRVIDPFDADSPLIYVELTPLSARCTRVTLETHHAIDDGWGQQQLLTATLDRYGRPEQPVEPAPDPFDAYVRLQHEQSESARARRFWDGYEMHDHFLCAPGDHKAARIGETDGSIRAHTVDAIYRYCQAIRVQSKAAFFCAVCRAIALIEGEIDVTLGAVTNGRTAQIDRALESVGLYWNILPFSMHVDAAVDVESELTGVHRALNEAADFSLYPLSRILRARGNRDFRYSLNFTNFDAVRRPARFVISNWAGQDRFHYPINVAINVDRSDGVNEIRIVADDDVFPNAMRVRLIEQVCSELDRIAAAASRKTRGAQSVSCGD
ncbi:hypothetical protein WS67_03795 [Burkholderia singularis]|uniref:Carrier domain-containing protein n=1 Tax=Burkholderia singularis TaxID=1503053 RepID=A0A103E7Y5_9BURK|nr:non-ribosomal peptide synthetase [Burkholderia singularis]KVE29999.1 hypothetical protein WS67_03795 [Burkholderia singularis]